MTFEEWFVEYGQFLWDDDDPGGTTLKMWQAATAARDEDWKAVVGATLGDVANVRKQATAAERKVWTRLVDDIMVAAEALTDSDYGEVNEENLDNLGDALSRMRDATDAAR